MIKVRNAGGRIQEEQDVIMRKEEEVGGGMFLWHESACVVKIPRSTAMVACGCERQLLSHAFSGLDALKYKAETPVI